MIPPRSIRMTPSRLASILVTDVAFLFGGGRHSSALNGPLPCKESNRTRSRGLSSCIEKGMSEFQPDSRAQTEAALHFRALWNSSRARRSAPRLPFAEESEAASRLSGRGFEKSFLDITVHRLAQL
jgi:hypothetical protein